MLLFDQFIGDTLGSEAQSLYKIIIDDPVSVARHINNAMSDIQKSRYEKNESYYFNWSLEITAEFQNRLSQLMKTWQI